MFLFVTLRFLSNLRITLIASLFYFLHVSLVCFNVSCINYHCFNKRQCLTVCTNLFSISFLNKQDWTFYVRSLIEKFPYSLTISISIQCSYLHPCLFECIYEERSNVKFPEFLNLEVFGYLNHRCRMGITSRGIPDRGYRMGIPGSIPVEDAHRASYTKLSYAGPSHQELPSRVQFLSISKAFIALNIFIPKFNYFVLFCVFFLWFPWKYCHFCLSLIATSPLESYFFYLLAS